jgi:hypothetical protein
MKKLAFLIGVGIGFLLGSKTGTGPYEQLETKVRSIANQPDVRDAVETSKEAAIHQVTETVNKVSDRSFDADDAVISTPSVPSNSA